MTDIARFLSPDTFVIYLFHGVTDVHPYEVRNYTGKHIDAGVFAGLMRDVSRQGHAISLEDVIAAREAGEKLPENSFAVTFDDGFANNYTVAAPILDELGIPATIYVTTGWAEVHGMSWIDRIEYCLETAPAGSLSLPWQAEPFGFDSVESKIALLNNIRYHAKRQADLDLDAFVDGIFAQCRQQPVSTHDGPLDRKLTWEQIAELHRHPLFTIGGHTHTHAIMAYLDEAALAREIDTSLQLLRERSGVPPRHYSYPEGTEFAYNQAVMDALTARGIVCCPAVLQDVNDGSESLMELRRIMVG